MKKEIIESWMNQVEVQGFVKKLLKNDSPQSDDITVESIKSTESKVATEANGVIANKAANMLSKASQTLKNSEDSSTSLEKEVSSEGRNYTDMPPRKTELKDAGLDANKEIDPKEENIAETAVTAVSETHEPVKVATAKFTKAAVPMTPPSKTSAMFHTPPVDNDVVNDNSVVKKETVNVNWSTRKITALKPEEIEDENLESTSKIAANSNKILSDVASLETANLVTSSSVTTKPTLIESPVSSESAKPQVATSPLTTATTTSAAPEVKVEETSTQPIPKAEDDSLSLLKPIIETQLNSTEYCVFDRDGDIFVDTMKNSSWTEFSVSMTKGIRDLDIAEGYEGHTYRHIKISSDKFLQVVIFSNKGGLLSVGSVITETRTPEQIAEFIEAARSKF